jgi:hypothetical protein
MDKEVIIEQAERIRQSTGSNPYGALAESKELFRTYAGVDNQFLASLNLIDTKTHWTHVSKTVQGVLNSFKEYVANDLLRSISLEREIQIETVSEYLEQAENLLNDKKIHPAAPAVIVGASLEEFLRNWLEEQMDISDIKNSLDSYSKELKRLGLINKQDLKDITSWGGTRNDAAHGHWDQVEDRSRIKLMLEGVNLFIRKYASQ